MRESLLKEGAFLLKHEVVMKDMRYSLEQVEKAKPIIKQLLNGGEIQTVEGDDNEVCLMLDRTCGTDYFQIYEKTGLVWGIGSRFQPIGNGQKPWNTFTIRRSRDNGSVTEFAKRQYAIKHNGVYPYLTMHGYYNQDTREIISLAIAKTADIWEYIEKGLAKVQHTNSYQIGQSSFFIVNWREFERFGYKLLKYEDEKDLSDPRNW